MPKVRVDKDELYPYYFIHESYGDEVDLTDEEIAKVAAAEDIFNEAQELLQAKLQAAKGA